MNSSNTPSQRDSVTISLDLLAPEHHHALITSIGRILSTESAEITFAQLVDGLPLAATGWNMRGSLLIRGHPLTQHESLCNGALDQIKEFRNAFDYSILGFAPSVLQAYQNAIFGSRDFNLRLIELVAIAIHQLAVLLFKLEPKLHVGDIQSVVSWKEEARWVTLEGGRRIYEEPLYEPKPTFFFHNSYLDYDQYPNGLADVAGYWAEDRIFGGVVLFDRGPSGLECKDLYFHSGREGTTFRVWRFLESQLNDFVDFLTSEELQVSPLPIFASDENLHRHDPWDAIALHHVYRDPWERKFPPTKPKSRRDVRSTGDYPELSSMFTQLFEAYQPRPEPDIQSIVTSIDSLGRRGPSGIGNDETNSFPVLPPRQSPDYYGTRSINETGPSGIGNDEINSFPVLTPRQSPDYYGTRIINESESVYAGPYPPSPLLLAQSATLDGDSNMPLAEGQESLLALSAEDISSRESQTGKKASPSAIPENTKGMRGDLSTAHNSHDKP